MSARTGGARVAGVVGQPVAHSLSPLIHNAWIEALGLDAAYVPFAPGEDGFERLVAGLRGSISGINVTLPFKERALALADMADAAAQAAGAANLLLFGDEGRVEARNTDGLGMLAAFAEQSPKWRATDAPTVVLGAGGAARGAVAALLAAGAPEVRVVNRTATRAQGLVERFPGATAWPDPAEAFVGAGAVIDATAAALAGDQAALPLGRLPPGAVVMDMGYSPLITPLLAQARARGLTTVDGLAMLIGQARPSFEALFGRPAPAHVDVRALAVAELERRASEPAT